LKPPCHTSKSESTLIAEIIKDQMDFWHSRSGIVWGYAGQHSFKSNQQLKPERKRDAIGTRREVSN
jgi:hypothetical protein